MIYVALIFGIPMAIATVMLSPAGLGDVTHGILMMSLAGLLITPIVGWATFAITAATEGISALVPLWLGGSVLAATVISFLATAMNYASKAIVNPHGHTLIPYSAYFGWWIGVFSICMLLSSGIWGAFARAIAPHRIFFGAIKTGIVLFGLIFSVATIIFKTPWTP